MYVNLGPHPPRLWPEDVDRLHGLWLRLTQAEGVGSSSPPGYSSGLWLRRLEQDVEGRLTDKVIEDLRKNCPELIGHYPAGFAGEARSFCRNLLYAHLSFGRLGTHSHRSR